MDKTVTVVLTLLALVALGFIIYSFIPSDSNDNGCGRVPMGYSVEDALMANAPMGNEQYLDAQPVTEPFYGGEVSSADASTVGSGVQASEDTMGGQNEMPRSVGDNNSISTGMSQLPSECYPKDVLSSVDLLPRDANSLYAQVNPSTQGSLQDQNFLTSGFHIGINTVGQTLRNANRQLRSEPPNPQVKVSPWNQTTIEYDINRLPLEIGGCA